jgi:hypothetical protein
VRVAAALECRRTLTSSFLSLQERRKSPMSQAGKTELTAFPCEKLTVSMLMREGRSCGRSS